MVAGRLTSKFGYWYIVLELKHEDGRRYSKWLTTNLAAPGNKKQAEELLLEKRMEFTKIKDIKDRTKGLYFDIYMQLWLQEKKPRIAESTYLSYYYIVNKIVKYFSEQKIIVSELKPIHIKQFYETLYSEGLNGNAVNHYHKIIFQAMKHAMRNELVVRNPAEVVESPKIESYTVRPYTEKESQELVRAIAGEKIEMAVLIAIYTGLRRSEVLGLKWKNIDFESNTILVDHAIKYIMVDDKRQIAGVNRLKCKASTRTLPLSETLKKHLLKEKEQRCDDYIFNPEDYICVDEYGDVLKPDYISKEFKNLLQKKNLRLIRFHDLRHPDVKTSLKILNGH